ncbi:hypothetical protein LVD15_19695 [Fulvivirga maritima]|uniref:hypothetical protein n=1 Tax=Fulvivirga maritima TaxID=2904247 RepID=UPI001F297793|nr:hypothetical protein [Fulvivirga maritima]UII25510.1 hypothetical protein LVD15_19695 [Fulvivirga maritima]
MKLFTSITIILLSVHLTSAQNPHFKTLGKLSKTLQSSSGIEVSDSKTIWTINDHGLPVVYGIDTTGQIIKAIHLNHSVIDWEDLALDQQGNLFVGDFGNNYNKRKNLKIYRIDKIDSVKDKVVTAKIIRFKLSDQKEFPPPENQMNFDIEAMIAYQDSLYLFSKSREKPFKGNVKLYVLPANNYEEEVEARLIDSISLGDGPMFENWITGATISKDQQKLILLSHGKFWLFTCFEGHNFFKGHVKEVNMQNFSQKEAVAFRDESTLILTDELFKGILGGNLYEYDITDILTTLNCN